MRIESFFTNVSLEATYLCCYNLQFELVLLLLSIRERAAMAQKSPTIDL